MTIMNYYGFANDFFFNLFLLRNNQLLYEKKLDFYSIFYSLTKKLYPSRMEISNGNFI